MRKLLMAAVTAFAVLVSHQSAQAEAVQIKKDSLALNGNLSLASGKTVKDGVVLITHGTLAHNGMEVIKVM